MMFHGAAIALNLNLPYAASAPVPFDFCVANIRALLK